MQQKNLNNLNEIVLKSNGIKLSISNVIDLKIINHFSVVFIHLSFIFSFHLFFFCSSFGDNLPKFRSKIVVYLDFFPSSKQTQNSTFHFIDNEIIGICIWGDATISYTHTYYLVPFLSYCTAFLFPVVVFSFFVCVSIVPCHSQIHHVSLHWLPRPKRKSIILKMSERNEERRKKITDEQVV